MSHLLQVFTTEQEPKPGYVAISTTQRNSERKAVTADQRCRCVLVPEASIQPDAGTMPSKFLHLVSSMLCDIAADRLKQQWQENGDPREVSASLFTVDSLLVFAAERKQREAMTGEKVAAWLKESATLRTLNDAARATWLARLPKIAAPGFRGSFTAEQAATIAGKISEEDHASPVCSFVLGRLASIMEAASTVDAF